MTHRRTAARLGIGLVLALAAAACGSGGGPGRAGSGSSEAGAATSATTASSTACVRNEQGTGCLPLAHDSRRIDLAAPVFSRPTEITNPLLPVAQVTFAPGYGEFSAGGGGDLEAVAMAVPLDAVGSAPPAGLAVLSGGARSAFAAAGAGRWDSVVSRAEDMSAAWRRDGGSGAPELLVSQMTGALDALAKAADARDAVRTRQAALRVEQAALDLELRHRPPAEVDLDRLDLWARQLRVDAAAKDAGAVAGDVATLQVIWDRSGHIAAPAAAERVTAGLAALGKAATGEDLQAAAAAVPTLRDAVAAARP